MVSSIKEYHPSHLTFPNWQTKHPSSLPFFCTKNLSELTSNTKSFKVQPFVIIWSKIRLGSIAQVIMPTCLHHSVFGISEPIWNNLKIEHPSSHAVLGDVRWWLWLGKRPAVLAAAERRGHVFISSIFPVIPVSFSLLSLYLIPFLYYLFYPVSLVLWEMKKNDQ